MVIFRFFDSVQVSKIYLVHSRYVNKQMPICILIFTVMKYIRMMKIRMSDDLIWWPTKLLVGQPPPPAIMKLITLSWTLLCGPWVGMPQIVLPSASSQFVPLQVTDGMQLLLADSDERQHEASWVQIRPQLASCCRRSTFLQPTATSQRNPLHPVTPNSNQHWITLIFN